MEDIEQLRDALNAATISCSGTDVTILCSDHETKDKIFNALEALAKPREWDYRERW